MPTPMAWRRYRRLARQSPTLRAWGQMHLAVLLFGFTGPLGKLLQQGSLDWYGVVVYRVALVTVGYVLLAPLGRRVAPLPRQALPLTALAGAALMVHWLLFYASIFTGLVSLTLICIATGPLLTTLAESLWNRQPVKVHELLLGLLTLVGIGLIFRFNLGYGLSLGLGLASAVLSVVYSLINKQLVGVYPAQSLNAYQLGLGLGVLLLAFPLVQGLGWTTWQVPSRWQDGLYLLLLAWVCTNWAYTLALVALKRIPTFGYMMAINVEPIYSILLAMALFGEGEAFDLGTVAGMALVLGTVFALPWVERRWGRPS